METGAAVLAGTSGLGGELAAVAGAAAGAAGSIASQGVEIAAGNQRGFNWKQVGLSALGGGISAELPSGFASGLNLGTTGQLMARAAVANALTQGIGVATGLQHSFSWQAVAASAVGAGAGQAVGPAFGEAFGNTAAGQFGARLATGLVAGTAAAVMRGGKVAIQQVATDAFGNALGQGLVDASAPQNSAQENFRLGEIRAENEQARKDALYGLAGGGGLGLQAMSGQGVALAGQDADLRLRARAATNDDVAGYAGASQTMDAWNVRKIFNPDDPNHYVIGAFLDGTWNKRPGTDLLDTRPGNNYTNVGLLELLSQGADNSNYRTKYFPGVGTDPETRLFGGATGAGVTLRAEDAYGWMVKQVNNIYSNNSNATFDFMGVGFSRGSLETRMVLRMVDERGIPDTSTGYTVQLDDGLTEVRYRGNIVAPRQANLNAVIFDTVTTGVGDFYNVDLPARAQVYHPIARDEMRTLFPSAPLAALGQPMSPSWFQPVLAGDHSDIGNNHDRGGLGDLNLQLARQFMNQKLGLPMLEIPSAYTPNPDNLWIHDMRGQQSMAPPSGLPFVRPLAPRYMPYPPIPDPYSR
jgi:hypothetical protein